MADQIRATPRSPILGLFSDLVNLPLQYMSSPERTQQMQGTAQFLYGTGIPKTLERASYGESLFSGAGGLGGTTRMRPETAETLMNVAPFAPVASRVADRVIKATEGLPVGMGIKDVGKIFPTSIANRSEVKNVANDFAYQFKQMGFDVILDHSGSKAGASSYLRVSDPQTGRFLSKPIRISDHGKGARELDANINVLNPQEDFAKITSALNDMRAEGDTLVFKQDRYAQELIASGVKPKTAYQRAKTEIAENQPSPYPQQAALPTQYPLAPAGTRYEEFGGDLTYMTPDEFLQQVRPLQLDAESLDNIAALRSHVEAGGKLDPLHIYASGKEDGRHRAYLAKELGIEKVPVALHGQPTTPIESPTYSDPFGNTIGSSIR